MISNNHLVTNFKLFQGCKLTKCRRPLRNVPAVERDQEVGYFLSGRKQNLNQFQGNIILQNVGICMSLAIQVKVDCMTHVYFLSCENNSDNLVPISSGHPFSTPFPKLRQSCDVTDVSFLAPGTPFQLVKKPSLLSVEPSCDHDDQMTHNICQNVVAIGSLNQPYKNH